MKLKAFVLVLLGILLTTNQVSAQYLSINGQFEVDQQLGCNDLTVTITNIDPGTDPNVIAFQFDGSGSPTTQNPVHTYTTPGTYWINQYIQGATGNKKDSVMVTVVSPELPIVELLSCNNFEVLLQIYDSYYDVYEIDYGDGTIIQINAGDLVPPHTYSNGTTRNVVVTGLFTTATNRCGAVTNIFTPTTTVLPAQMDSLVVLDNSTIKIHYQLPSHSVNKLEVSVGSNANYVLYNNLVQNTAIDTLQGLNLNLNQYCFRLATYDACSNFRSYSNDVCSVNLTSSTQNNQITLDWNTISIGAGQTTNIYRDGMLHQSFASSVTQHIDSTVVCNTEYCYQSEMVFPGGAIAYSLTTCETAFSSDLPPTIDNISSSTGDETITWTWEVPMGVTPSYFLVHEVSGTGSVLKTDTITSNVYTNPHLGNTKYLAVEVYDICSNTSSNGIIASNIVLDGIRNSAEEIVVSWNNNLGWIDGILEYVITIKDQEGNLVDSLSVGLSTSYSLPLENQTELTLLFTVWAIPVKSSLTYTRSNILTFERLPIISIPNTFTPNGDGINDRFVISGKFIESYEMQIFNRWGEVLYFSDDLETGWDGSSRGEKLPVGNYAYWMRIKDLNANEHIRTGSILILSN